MTSYLSAHRQPSSGTNNDTTYPAKNLRTVALLSNGGSKWTWKCATSSGSSTNAPSTRLGGHGRWWMPMA